MITNILELIFLMAAEKKFISNDNFGLKKVILWNLFSTIAAGLALRKSYNNKGQ